MLEDMLPEQENLTKIVRFDNGPISAIGCKFEIMEPKSGRRAGDIIVFTPPGSFGVDKAVRSSKGYYKCAGVPSEPQAYYIALGIDTPAELQMRKVISVLEKSGHLTPEQRQQAYEQLGINELLYKGSMKEGRVY